MKRFFVPFVIAVAFIAGCESVDYSQQIDALKTTIQQSKDASAEARTIAQSAYLEAERLRAEATTQPAEQAAKTIELSVKTEAAAKQIEKYAEKADSVLSTAQSTLDSVIALSGAAGAGDPQGVGGAVSSILTKTPLGPWGAVIGTLAGLGLGVYQTAKRAKTQQNLENIVKSIEVALPDWDEATKEAVAAIQGPETSSAVEAAKSKLGL